MQPIRHLDAPTPSELERTGSIVSSVGPNSDERLVDELQRGKDGARAELFDRYGPFVLRVLVRMLGTSEPECADLLHEVFVRALERIGSLRDARSLRSWLAGIAARTAQEWLRRRKRHGVPHPPEAGAQREARSVSPEARQAVVSFYAMLDRFPEQERSAFVLRQLEGMSLQEVAKACAVSFSTARRRIDRAERRFESLLPEYPALFERHAVHRRRK